MSQGEKKPIRILLVEDDEGHAKLINQAFNRYGDEFLLQTAVTLEEARSYLADILPDLVIADIKLPDGKGTELLRAGADETGKLPFPLVVMTSFGDEQMAVDIIKAGAQDYIVKMASLFRDIPNIARRILREWEHIVQRRQAEEALKESERKYRMLFNSMMDAFAFHEAVYDENGKFVDYRYLEINQQYEHIVGLEREKVLGRSVKELFPDSAPHWIDYYEKVAETGEPVRFEYFHESTGKYYEVNTYSPEPDTFASVFSDITERKRAEKEKQELEEKLINSKKMEAIGHLAGGVAHDLNNVLSGIVSYPDILLLKLPQDSGLRKIILTIQKSGQRAAAIVQDMLTLARRGVAITEVVDLRDVLTNCLLSPEYERLKKNRIGVTIETSFDADLLNIKGSFFHLSKTVMNLVVNGIEAMPEGGTLEISLKNRYVDRFLKAYDLSIEEGEYVVLSVRDSGKGLSRQDLKQVFEPFYTRKVMGRGGTGLGMAVVWGTVKDHGGYINVTTNEKDGTCFELFFPCTREQVAAHEEGVPLEDYIGNGEKILVVDDVKEQREIATALLTTLGYEVDSVDSGEAALEYLKENRVDLMVLDMIMDPGIDGLDTYKRAIEVVPGLKVVIASGYSETERVKEAQRLGAGAYVRKPYVLEKIGVVVKAELNG